MAIFARLILAAAVLPFVFATDSSCGGDNSKFYYAQKDCCVPRGGPPSPPSPPQGTQCPPSGWSWYDEKACCVPHQPPQPTQPPPQCNNGWGWDEPSSTCCPNSGGNNPPPAPPKPSSKPGNPYHYKRAAKSRAAPICPPGLEACPISGLTGPTGDVECLDTYAELESCGGCASTGAGQDCTAIPGVWNVACVRGACAIQTCAQGYKLSADGKSCTKL